MINCQENFRKKKWDTHNIYIDVHDTCGEQKCKTRGTKIVPITTVETLESIC